MRRLPLLAAVILAPALVAWSGTPASAAPRIQRVESPGGIVAWLIEDRRIPIVSLQFAFRGGSALDPADKLGLANMATRLLDEGAGEMDAQAFQTEIEDLSIGLSFEDARDATFGSLKTLSPNRARAFDLLRLALARPRFDAEAVERIRGSVVSRLKRLEADPDHMAGRLWWRRALGDHPYARPAEGTPETVARIGVEDLRGFVRGRFARDNLIVAVVGDIAPDELALALDRIFGPLPARAEPWALPEAAVDAKAGTALVEKGVPQSIAVFGGAGFKRDDPDWYAAVVMNHILGGGSFSSRLYREVREKRGLAYSVYTYLAPLDRAALVMGGVSTENARLADSLATVRAEWRRLAEAGATPEEVAEAKAFLNGSFPLQFDSTDRIARLLLSMQIDRLGMDYLDRRQALIEAVGAADVIRAARRMANADALVFAVVGRPAGLDGAARVPAVQ